MTKCPICKKDIDHLRFQSSRSAIGDVFVDKYGDLEWDIEYDEVDEEEYCCPLCKEVIEIEEDKVKYFLNGSK